MRPYLVLSHAIKDGLDETDFQKSAMIYCPMVIQTERLYARPWSLESDIDSVLDLYGHPEVVRFIGNRRIETPEAAREYLQLRINMTRELGGTLGFWALVLRATEEVIGNILLKPLPGKNRVPTSHIEVGWHLTPSAWGQGYATEAGRAMLLRAFSELGLERVLAVAEPDNLGSIAVMRRLEMTPLGRTTDFYDGEILEQFERRI